MKDSLHFVIKKGTDITEVFDPLARLRMAVFREYPYLYEGSIAYEKEYLETYTRSAQAFLFAVYDGPEMVGATTALPLQDETAGIRQPFEAAACAMDSLFYFGESILLKPYRGLGLGHRFFDEREAHARSYGTYTTACFFAVARPADHPQKPADYRSNEAFWTGRGYRQHPELQAQLSWPDLGATASSAKSLICWMKDL